MRGWDPAELTTETPPVRNTSELWADIEGIQQVKLDTNIRPHCMAVFNECRNPQLRKRSAQLFRYGSSYLFRDPVRATCGCGFCVGAKVSSSVRSDLSTTTGTRLRANRHWLAFYIDNSLENPQGYEGTAARGVL